MKTLAIRDPEVDYLLNVIVNDEQITVRTLMMLNSTEGLSAVARLSGDSLHDYLGGIGADKEVYNAWCVDLGRVTPKAWFLGTDIGLTQDEVGGTRYGATPNSVIVERHAMTIMRDSRMLGKGTSEADATVYEFSSDYTGELFLANRTLGTLDARNHFLLRPLEQRRRPLVSVYQRYGDSKWSDSFVKLHVSAQGLKVWHNLAHSQAQEWDTVVRYSDFILDPSKYEPTQKMSAIAAQDTVGNGDAVEVEVHVLDDAGNVDPTCNSVVYVDCISGQAASRQVQAVSGIAKFRLHANVLRAGEKLVAKFGWRNYPSICGVAIPVT